MMKKILAAAIVSAFAAPAFAATSNVDIYGSVNFSVDFVDGGTDGALADLSGPAPALFAITRGVSGERRTRVSSNNSLIGFKGAEDLGGGLSAVWQIESSIAMDAGALNTAGTRNTFGGLSSKTLGTLTFGVIDSPLKTSTGKLDVFGNTLADYRSIFGALGGSQRPGNSIHYATPNFSGLSAKLQYAARNEGGNGATANPTFWSGSVTYENGPLFATLANEQTKGKPGIGFGETGGNDDKLTTTRAGVGYAFGSAKLGLAYERTNFESPIVGDDFKRGAWYLSGAYAMGNTTLKAAYTKAGDFKGEAGGPDSGADQISVGVDYALSKRTGVYALYSQVKNDNNMAYSLAGGATGVHAVLPAELGQDPKGFSIGMVHKF